MMLLTLDGEFKWIQTKYLVFPAPFLECHSVTQCIKIEIPMVAANRLDLSSRSIFRLNPKGVGGHRFALNTLTTLCSLLFMDLHATM